eukprot:Gb_39518 [translate_table: standard]
MTYTLPFNMGICLLALLFVQYYYRASGASIYNHQIMSDFNTKAVTHDKHRVYGSQFGTVKSPWLTKTTGQLDGYSSYKTYTNCQVDETICQKGSYHNKDPSNIKCCNKKCVDVGSNPFNCGQCGSKCLFGWRCCNGMCVDTNIDILNCGRCNHRCPPGILCMFSMCGYSFSPLPVSPVPPLPPFPPLPLPPILTFPPRLPLPPPLPLLPPIPRLPRPPPSSPPPRIPNTLYDFGL